MVGVDTFELTSFQSYSNNNNHILIVECWGHCMLIAEWKFRLLVSRCVVWALLLVRESSSSSSKKVINMLDFSRRGKWTS